MWSSYLGDGVVVDVDDLVEVPGNDLRDLVQFLEIKFPISDEAIESDGGQVAHSYFIGFSILHYLSTQVA